MAGQHTDSPPMPYKRYEIWNHCSKLGWDIAVTHNSHTCRWLGPNHNHAATRMNTLGGLVVGLHKTILPLAAG